MPDPIRAATMMAVKTGPSSRTIASATAEGIRQVASAIQTPGGLQAVNLRIAEQYVEQFGKLAKESNTLIIPQSLSDPGGFIAAAMKIIKEIPAAGTTGV